MNSQESTKKPIIIFDMGGVLLEWNPRHLFRKMFNGDEERMEYFLSNVCDYEWNVKQDLGRKIEKAVEEKIALFPDYEPYIRAYYGRYNETVVGEILGTVDILADLRASGFILAGLSNWSGETFELMRKRFDFLDWFKDIVVSGEVGMIKPDPAIYQLTLERIGSKAEDCLFIDDNEENVDAARVFGMDAILFASPQQLAEELRTRKLLT